MWVLLTTRMCSAGPPAEHLLIWHIDTQSLARRGISASDELHRLLSLHGRIVSLELYLHLSAAAVSFTRTQDAQKVRHLSEVLPLCRFDDRISEGNPPAHQWY